MFNPRVIKIASRIILVVMIILFIVAMMHLHQKLTMAGKQSVQSIDK